MKEMPKYIAQPNAAAVAITADMLPSNPNQGFERTQSPIKQVTTENTPIKMKVELKNGITVLVFFSSSWSRVREANRATDMCLNRPVSSAIPTASKNASSHAAPLKNSTDIITTCRSSDTSYRETLLRIKSCPTFLFVFLTMLRSV